LPIIVRDYRQYSKHPFAGVLILYTDKGNLTGLILNGKRRAAV